MGVLDLRELMEKTKLCASLDELRSLMEAQGIWLNDAAAATAFRAVEVMRQRGLSDAELAQVVGGGVIPPGTSPELADAEQTLLSLLEALTGQVGAYAAD